MRENALVRSARQDRQRAKMPALPRPVTETMSLGPVRDDELEAVRQTSEQAALEVSLLRAEVYSARVSSRATRETVNMVCVVFLAISAVSMAIAMLALFLSR